MKASEVSTSYEYPVINVEEATVRFQSIELKPDNGGESSFVIFKWEAVAPETVQDADGADLPFAGNMEGTHALYVRKNGKSSFDDKKQDSGAKWLKNLDEKLSLPADWDTESLTQATFDRYKGKAITCSISTKIKGEGAEQKTNYKLGWAKTAATQYNQ